MSAETLSEFLVSFSFDAERRRDAVPRISLAMDATSIAGRVHKMIADAVKQERLSETEAALVYDMIAHTKLPELFRFSRENGGYRREERF